MKRLVKRSHCYFTAAEGKNNKCRTHWGLTGGKRSLFFRLNANRSKTDKVSPNLSRWSSLRTRSSYQSRPISQVGCPAQDHYRETAVWTSNCIHVYKSKVNMILQFVKASIMFRLGLYIGPKLSSPKRTVWKKIDDLKIRIYYLSTKEGNSWNIVFISFSRLFTSI